MKSVGSHVVGEEWNSTFVHPRLKVGMMVYVDDFKASGPPDALAEAWHLITDKAHIDLDPPRPLRSSVPLAYFACPRDWPILLGSCAATVR